MPNAPRLILLDGFSTMTERAGHAFPLEAYPFSIGRARECDFVIDHTQISRLHARLEYDHEQVVITDLGSTNGTWVNSERLTVGQPRRLRAGDRIVLAQVCTVEFDDPGTTSQIPLVIAPTAGLSLDEDGAQVLISGQRLDPALSPGQFMLLQLLVKNEGRVVSREEVRYHVWGQETDVTDQTIDALVSRLRKRLTETDPTHEYIVTRRGFGLMFRNRYSDISGITQGGLAAGI